MLTHFIHESFTFLFSHKEEIHVKQNFLPTPSNCSSHKKQGFLRSRAYWPRCERASCSGALGIRSSPSNGRFSSTIRKIAPETDSAQISRIAITVALVGA